MDEVFGGQCRPESKWPSRFERVAWMVLSLACPMQMFVANGKIVSEPRRPGARIVSIVALQQSRPARVSISKINAAQIANCALARIVEDACTEQSKSVAIGAMLIP